MINKIYKIKRALYSLWLVIIPECKQEWFVFCGAIVYYAIILCLLICVSFPKGEFMEFLGYDTDIRFSTDPIMMSSENLLKWSVRHPLYTSFYFPIIFVNELLLKLGWNITRPLFMSSSVIVMGFSYLFLYKILRTIKLENRECLALLCLFGSFAHIILLGIQVDSFVITMFLLLLMILLFCRHHHNFLTDNLLFLGLTGTTSTSFIKFAIYQFLEEKSIRITFKRFIQSTLFFVITLFLTIPDLLFRLSLKRGLIYAFIGDTLQYTGSRIDKCHLFIDNFLSEPILYHDKTGIVFSPETINLPSYPYPFFYLPVAILFFFTLLSVIINRKQMLTWLFCLCFTTDIIIHFGICYGIEEAQLFCGHWIFYLPIMIGLFIKHLAQKKAELITFVIMIVAFFIWVYNISCFIRSL